MNDVIPFEFDDAEIRVVIIGSDPWWVANDIAKVLGYKHTPHMVRLLDDDEKGVHIVDTLGGDQSLTVISESGLFACILKSRREEAQRFRRWVTGQVLPALRRTGRYEMPGGAPELPAAEHYDTAMLSASVATVRTAIRLFGNETARKVWITLGLPYPIADARHGEPDGFAKRVAEIVSNRTSTTLRELADALGLDGEDQYDRGRISQVLKLLGWSARRARRDGKLEYVWRPNAAWEA